MQTGKISRFPVHIREQLNHRLENSEPSPRLLEWLNSIPEVQAILKDEFASEPVSKQNLNTWKKNAFRNWQIRRTALEFAAENSPGPDAKDTLSASISQKLSHWVCIRYAALAHSLAPPENDPAAELRQLNELCAAVTALRRGDLSAERVLLEQKRLTLLESTTREEREKLFWEWTNRPEVQAKLHPQPARDEVRREVERMLNYKLLGIPYTPEVCHEIDPAVLI